MSSINMMLSLIFLAIGLCGAESDENFTLDFPKKCAVGDSECLKEIFVSTLHKYSDTGIPELGIPAMNPYEVKNTTISVLSMVDFIMTDGKVEGLVNCPLTKFEADFEKRVVTSESMCESVLMTGRYKIEVGSLVESLVRNNITGDGNGKIQIDQMTLKTKVPFNIEKHDDGEIYIIPKISQIEYSTEDIGIITFGADNVMYGIHQISAPLISFMNRNWKLILRSFGKFFSDKVMDTFYEYLQKLFVVIPAKNYISDDLTSYVESNKLY